LLGNLRKKREFKRTLLGKWKFSQLVWGGGKWQTGSWENGKAGMKYIFKHNVTGVAKATTARRFSLQPLSLLLG